MIVSSGSRKRCESSSVVSQVLLAAFEQRDEYTREELLELLYQKVRPELLASINIIRRENDAKKREKSVEDIPDLDTATLIRRGAVDGLNAWVWTHTSQGRLKKIIRGRSDWSIKKVANLVREKLKLNPINALVLKVLVEHKGKAVKTSELRAAIRESDNPTVKMNAICRNLRRYGHVITTELVEGHYQYTLKDSP
jgi:hypothetical protein